MTPSNNFRIQNKPEDIMLWKGGKNSFLDCSLGMWYKVSETANALDDIKNDKGWKK